jgi:glycosyltransferase involved in cell wall biosynthesis
VILLGHRANDQVGLLLAVARHGLSPLIGPCGAYACGSRKEEFGLALVEAMAAGLPVVAPREGGPSTYVEDGVTGVLVDTTDAAAIARGLLTALGLAREPGTAARTRDVVERRFTLDRMAQTLAAVYRTAATLDPAVLDARGVAA